MAGAVASVWDQVTPYHLLGVSAPAMPAAAAANPTPGIARSVGPGASELPSPWHPDSPLFWFGALAAVTFGLVALSTSIRIGPIRASGSVGKT